MFELNANHQDLTIQQASETQITEIIKRVAAQWGDDLTGVDHFTQVHALNDVKEYGTEGKCVYWVLVPKSNRNTTDFYACCRTYRREVLVLRPNQAAAASEVGYAITAVVTQPIHRGKGYAKHMMTLIHRALAPHIYPDPDIDIPNEVKPATLSVLFSDVGDFYAHCGPNASESGWKIQNATSTTWIIKETLALLDSLSPSTYDFVFLSEPQVADLLDRDTPDLDNLARSPTAAYFAFPPRLPQSYLISRSEIHPSYKQVSSEAWGAHIPYKGHFVVWWFDYGEKKVMINRLKADSDTFPLLLRAVLQAGEIQECDSAEAWSVPQVLLDTAKLFGGTTEECKNHFPAYRWYGPEHEGEVTWVMNEHYSWC
ncbi:hypothetical protein BDV93DRAFT_525598 [Ceratobasidium sp. AG-I]|nr:hypothetical protein BDV93DRAFT_525598 [Ceratobasidium sp. AG-I]